MKKFFLVLATVLLLIVLWIISARINVFPMADFLEYWASGRLNLTGGNPYDADQMLSFEKPLGMVQNDALRMLNPPWVLPFAMFFRLFEYPFSRFLGFIIHMSIVFVCSMILWRYYQSSKYLSLIIKWFWWYPVFLLVWYLLSYRHLTRQVVVGQNSNTTLSQGNE